MNSSKEPIQQLSEIHHMMERSSRFISLSGLSGVSAGIFALAGAVVAFYHLNGSNVQAEILQHSLSDEWRFVLVDALAVLILALSSGIYFTTRRARKKGLKVWDRTAQRMLINLFVPLATGGIFAIILYYHHLVLLIAPVTLIFYGLALINASKYTFHEIRALGFLEILLGLLSSVFTGYGLICWALGFGVMHIIYGIMMYWRYEKPDDRNLNQ